MSNRKYLLLCFLGVLSAMLIHWWSKYGNLRVLMSLYTFDVLCFASIISLLTFTTIVSINQKRITLWVVGLAILLSIIPVIYLLQKDLLRLSPQFLIVYNVVIFSVLITFRKQIMQWR